MHQLTIYVAKYLLVVPLIITTWVWVRQRGWAARVYMTAEIICGGVLALLLAKIAGYVYYDTRPFVAGHFVPWVSHAADNGFPSDHTLLAAFLAYVALRYSPRLGGVMLILAAGIGAARVAAGVHHVTDVIGSFIIAGIGFLLGELLVKVAQKIYVHFTKRQATGV